MQKPDEMKAKILANYRYDPSTGRIISTKTGYCLKNRICKGHLYIGVWLNGKMHNVSYHRSAWLLAYGDWPDGVIDHIDGNPLNNRLDNLRQCSHEENKNNSYYTWKPNAVTGIPGVSTQSRVKNIFFTSFKKKNIYSYSPHFLFILCALMGRRYKPAEPNKKNSKQ